MAVVDDDPASREAVRIVIEPAGWTVVPYETARAAISAARAHTLADMVLMDMSLPGESAGRAIAEIRRLRPELSIVVLSSHQREDYVFEALRAGAVGYVLKQQAMKELAEVLDIVDAGGSPLSPGIARRVLATFREAGERFDPLSEREREILVCFADGKTYAEAADALDISIDTVRTHVRRMYAKLDVRSRPQAVLAALKRGLLR